MPTSGSPSFASSAASRRSQLERKLVTAAHGRAADLTESHLRKLLDALVQALQALDIGVQRPPGEGAFFQERIRSRSAPAANTFCALRICRTETVAVAQLIEQAVECRDQGIVDGIHRGPCQGHDRDASAPRQVNHDGAPEGPPPPKARRVRW